MSILALTSDTLIGTPATGNIEYNGQFFGTDSNASRAQLQRLVLSTAVASTSGTSIDFTGLPAWVKRVTVMFQGVSTSGTSNLLIQLGSGSITSSGYSSVASQATGGATSTAGFITTVTLAAASASARYGQSTLTNITGNTWVVSGLNTPIDNSLVASISVGSIALAGVLDRVRITTVNGTDTFDLGSINILYEG